MPDGGVIEKMSSKRFILYTEESSSFKIPAFLASQVHTQKISQLSSVPAWLQEAPKPLLVDTVKKQGLWGTELHTFVDSKRPTKFSQVESLSDTM